MIMKKIFFIEGIFAISLLSLNLMVYASHDEEHEEHEKGKQRSKQSVEVLNDTLYINECGSCHIPYPSGLLPSRSWEKMLKVEELKNHFGENASLEADVSEKIKKMLIEHSADNSNFRRSKKIAKRIPSGESPLRFSDTKYFKSEHHEISAATWKRPSIASPANCNACHEGAAKGIFSEHDVRIPKK